MPWITRSTLHRLFHLITTTLGVAQLCSLGSWGNRGTVGEGTRPASKWQSTVLNPRSRTLNTACYFHNITWPPLKILMTVASGILLNAMTSTPWVKHPSPGDNEREKVKDTERAMSRQPMGCSGELTRQWQRPARCKGNLGTSWGPDGSSEHPWSQPWSQTQLITKSPKEILRQW